jgi:hypothetical protein
LQGIASSSITAQELRAAVSGDDCRNQWVRTFVSPLESFHHLDGIGFLLKLPSVS